jgi:O-antigen/teichoic acid export membrane protein
MSSTDEGQASGTHTRGLRTNTLLNLAGYTLPLFVSLVTIPRYLSLVGQARYGVLLIVWIMLGYFGVFDLGLGRATTHEIAKIAPDDHEAASAVFWTATGVNAALGAIGGLVLLPVAYVLVQYVFKMPHELRGEVTGALPFLALAVPLVTVSSVFTGALQGRERFVASNANTVLYGVLFQLIPLGVAEWNGPKLVPLIGSAVAVLFFTTLVSFVWCVLLIPARQVRFERARVSRLFRFGAWISVTGVIAPLLTILDRLAVAATVGAGGVTRYGVPFNLATRIWVIPISFSRTAFPRIATLARAGAEQVTQEVVDALFAVLTPLVIIGILVFEPFLHIWVGTSLGASAPRIGEILLLGAWINGLAYIPNVYLQASGRPDVPAKIHMLEVLPFLVVLWVSLKSFGVEGGALAWTLRATADALVLFWVCRIRWRIRPEFVPGIVLLAAAFGLAMFFPDSSSVRLGGDVVIVVATLVWSWLALPPSARSAVGRIAASPLAALRRQRSAGPDVTLPAAARESDS